jgi:hypothetical protein
MVFGAVHALAWNFAFPTYVELTLWRVSTAVAMAAPPLGLLALPLVQLHRRWGNPDVFTRSLVRILQQYISEAQLGPTRIRNYDPVVFPEYDRIAFLQKVEKAVRRLHEGHEASGTPSRVHYSEIFDQSYDGVLLCRQLAHLVRQGRSGQGPVGSMALSADFEAQLYQLVGILVDRAPKKLLDDAVVGVYPRRPLIPGWVNAGIVYVTGILYCVARLSLIGLAFSCLRWMPDSVYIGTWTMDIPSFR